MRYHKQRDRYTCGPTAIMNAFKWAGHKPPKLAAVIKASGCVKRLGSDHSSFDKALRDQDIFSVRRVYQPTLGDIKRHINNDGAVILSYAWRYSQFSGRHFALIIKGSRYYPFSTINDERDGPALQSFGASYIRNRHYQFKKDKHRKAWFLEKI